MPHNRYHAGPPGDHFDGTRFRNLGQPTTDPTLRQVLRWKFAGGAATWPAHVPVTPAVPDRRVAGLRATMVGHASVLIQIGGYNVLTDPVWSTRASPFRFAGPKRVTAPGIAFDRLPPIDAVLLSHNHYDHLDLDTLARLHARDRPVIAAPLGNDTIVHARLPDAVVRTADWDETIALTPDLRTHLVPANHWSARWMRDRRMALWAGHVLETPASRVYFAGDTGYGDGAIFDAIGARHGPSDLALIPIGAYAPRWFMAGQHVDPAEAVRIFEQVGARHALGIHWGTFRLTDEPREQPAARLAAALAARGIDPARFAAATPGMVLDVPPG